MSCSAPVFACIQDINRVISILNDAPISGEQNVKENVGKYVDCISNFEFIGAFIFCQPTADLNYWNINFLS